MSVEKTEQLASSAGLPLPPEYTESLGYVQRVLNVLEMLASDPAPVDEIAKSLNVHKRTTQRLLHEMMAAGFVQQLLHEPLLYDLTPKIITIAGVYRERLSLIDISRPYVLRLRDLTGEYVHLDIPVEGKVVGLLSARSKYHLKADHPAGKPGPMHASAVGKALMAYLPTQFELACRLGLERYTANTLTTPAALASYLAQVRQQMYAVDDEEIELGQRCIAAPVWDDTGQVIAALGISGPTQRIHAETSPHLAHLIMTAAQELSRDLGYSKSQEFVSDVEIK